MNFITINDKNIFPSKIVCIGRNYADHIAELNNETPDEMVFFIKPNSSISDTLKVPRGYESCHYEAEISFLIEEGKISGVGFGLDLTLREVQAKLKAKGLPWERAKAFDGSAVFSKFVPFNAELEGLEVELYIDGVLKQKGGFELMMNKPIEVIKEFQTFASFEDGDILMTGTPKGVGAFKQGEQFKGRILYKGEVLIEESFNVV